MKTIRIFFFISIITLIACEDPLTEKVNFNAEVVESKDITISPDGTITAPVGTSITFNLSGNADFITFSYDLFDQTTSTLSFSSLLSWNNDPDKTLQLYISNSFAGLKKNEALADSATIRTHDWKDISELCNFPTDRNGTATSSLSLNEFKGDTITLAFKYKTKSNSGFQPMWTVSDLAIDNVAVKTGESVVKTIAAAMGFSPFDMFKVRTGEAYNTGTAGGTWDTSLPASLKIRQTASGRDLNEDWLISAPIAIPAGKIIKGTPTSIKNITEDVNSYNYTFKENGEYTLTFKATNYNYKTNSETERSFKIIIE